MEVAPLFLPLPPKKRGYLQVIYLAWELVIGGGGQTSHKGLRKQRTGEERKDIFLLFYQGIPSVGKRNLSSYMIPAQLYVRRRNTRNLAERPRKQMEEDDEDEITVVTVARPPL